VVASSDSVTVVKGTINWHSAGRGGDRPSLHISRWTIFLRSIASLWQRHMHTNKYTDTQTDTDRQTDI